MAGVVTFLVVVKLALITATLRPAPAEEHISCVAPRGAVVEGRSAFVSCYFSEEFLRRRNSFSIVRYPFNATQDGIQSRTNVVVCSFGPLEAPICIADAGYVLDYSQQSVVTAHMAEVTNGQAGVYTCRMAGEESIHTCTCNVTVTADDVSETTVRSNYSVAFPNSTVIFNTSDSNTRGYESRPFKAQVIPTLVIAVLIMMLFFYLCLRSNLCPRKRKFTNDDGYHDDERPPRGRRTFFPFCCTDNDSGCCCRSPSRDTAQHEPFHDLYDDGDDENWVPREKNALKSPVTSPPRKPASNFFVLLDTGRQGQGREKRVPSRAALEAAPTATGVTDQKLQAVDDHEEAADGRRPESVAEFEESYDTDKELHDRWDRQWRGANAENDPLCSARASS